MDPVYGRVFMFYTVCVSIILLQPTSTSAEFYTIKNHQVPLKSSPHEKSSLPRSVCFSQTECVIKCRSRVEGEILQPFLTNQNECFCLKDDQQKLDALSKENSRMINGSLFIKVSII